MAHIEPAVITLAYR